MGIPAVPAVSLHFRWFCCCLDFVRWWFHRSLLQMYVYFYAPTLPVSFDHHLTTALPFTASPITILGVHFVFRFCDALHSPPLPYLRCVVRFSLPFRSFSSFAIVLSVPAIAVPLFAVRILLWVMRFIAYVRFTFWWRWSTVRCLPFLLYAVPAILFV